MQPLVKTAIADATMEHPHSDDKFVSIKPPSSTDNIANDAMAVNGKLRVGVLGLVDAYNQTVDAHSENENSCNKTEGAHLLHYSIAVHMACAMLSDKNTPASVDKFIEQLKAWETDMLSSQIGATDAIHDKIQQVKTNMHAIMHAYKAN
jgi:hypothetical protein